MPKRDLDRIRDILIYLENAESDDGWVWIRSDQFFADTDSYQIKLMEQAGFINADAHGLGSPLPGRLTIRFAGHDYLESVRSQGVWEKTKAAVEQEGGSASLEVVKTVASAFLKKQIADKTGLEL